MAQRDETITGGRELDDLLQTLPTNIERNILRAALRAGAAVMLDEVRQRIPEDTGQLRASARVTTRYRKGQVSASVKVGNFVAWYAHLVEFGTRPHYIKVSDVDRGRGRNWRRRERGLASISTVNRRVLQIGANFVGPSVHHPGARARPFMRPAADAALQAAIAAVTARIRERLTRQGIDTPAPTPSGPEE